MIPTLSVLNSAVRLPTPSPACAISTFAGRLLSIVSGRTLSGSRALAALSGDNQLHTHIETRDTKGLFDLVRLLLREWRTL